jgi:hypothetical protein
MVAHYNRIPKEFFSGYGPFGSPIVTDTGERFDFEGCAYVDHIVEQWGGDGGFSRQPSKVTFTVYRPII